MRTAIVYEGSNDSSAAIVRLIAAAAAGHGPVVVGEVGEIPIAELEGVDFLVVAGPTHRCDPDPGRSPSAARVLRETRAGQTGCDIGSSRSQPDPDSPRPPLTPGSPVCECSPVRLRSVCIGRCAAVAATW